MAKNKKEVRNNFRDAVFKRDKFTCRMCGFVSNTHTPTLDAHHIIDRHIIPNGGYIKENGISLCENCHKLAEVFHSTGVAYPGYSPEDLFKKINSSETLAMELAEKLK